MRRAFVGLLAILGCEGTIGPPSVEAQRDASCRSDDDCGSGVCLVEAGGAVCRSTCETSATCSDGRVCGVVDAPRGVVRLACRDDVAETDRGVCAGPEDCATGLCFESRCTEPCWVCPVGEACLPARVETAFGETELPVCQPRLAAAALSLGPVATSSAGRSAVQSFDVPPGTGGVVVIVRDDEGGRVAVTRLEGPDGAVLVDRLQDGPDVNPMSPYIEVASLLLPSSDLVFPSPGTWRFEVGTFDPARFDELVPVEGEVDRVDVVFEPESEAGGALDLHLGLADAFGLTATTATRSPFVRELLAQVEVSLFGPAGIEQGELQVSVLDPSHDRVEDGDETRGLCRSMTRPGPHGTTANVFLVDDLVYTSGHSGGTPGPPGVFQTAASCIVAERLRSGRDTGILVAHELGHYLGLRHTTELDGTADPIADTPQCPSQTDVRDCPDYRNLMFPRFPLDPSLSLTEGQIRVIRNNPILYE